MTDISTRTVVVYGALRSGTTLLRLMLDGHPRLSCPGETDFLFDHLTGTGRDPRYNHDALERDRIYRAHMAKYADTPLESRSPDAFISRIAGQDRIAVLMLHRHVDRVLDLYPDMRFVHMLRDPRDVARSSIGMGWAGTTYHGVGHWIDTETGWQAVAGRLPEKQVLTLRYEELIRDAEGELQRLCAFCGLDYDPDMMSYASSSTYDRPNPKLVEQWKRKQTPEEIALVEGRIGPLLGAAGYAPSGHAPITLTALHRFGLALANRKAVWADRIRRFGLLDPLIVAVCRKLGLGRMGGRAQRRIDGKTLQYLK